ncbi:MAG TPA: AraC family transcriptional regulator [Coleofasciculaceae cyanobacterium]|jgi:AraC-like DNA-binding protein
MCQSYNSLSDEASAIVKPSSGSRESMTVDFLREEIFTSAERKMPLDQAPLCQLPKWGHWIETPNLIVALVPRGNLEVNITPPFELISTRFEVGHGVAAFNSDKLETYQSQPGGFDVVPEASTYRSIETAGPFIILAYKRSLASRIVAEYTSGKDVELVPGQVQASAKGLGLAQAVREFFPDKHIGGALYLESVATLIMEHIIRHRSNVSGQLKRVPDFLVLKKLKTVIEYIQDNLQSELSLDGIAGIVGLSPYYFAHAFKATTGIPPYQYVLQCRVERAKKLLREPSLSIADIAYEAGFGNQSHMTTVFRKTLQVTPNVYRQQVAK